MEVSKKVISNLTKCYALARLHYNDTEHILVASEIEDKCLLFDLDGNLEETVWDKPGGVMSMVQIPGSNGQFLSTHKFYSFNDAKESKIVIVTPKGKDDWEVRTLVELPFVHRIDVINVGGVNYLIAAALKSGHEFDDDWNHPGKIYIAVLPDDLSTFNDANQLELTVLKDNLQKNHGYCKTQVNGNPAAIISAENGVFYFIPPQKPSDDWKIEQILDVPTSDVSLIDLDGDGEEELFTISPFHGNHVIIYKKYDGKFVEVYQHPNTEFLHAIWCGNLCGKNSAVFGNRGGAKDLMVITYDMESKSYKSEIIDHGRGPANILHYAHNGKDVIVAANRETDEVAMYTMNS